MKQFLENLAALGTRRLILLGGTGFGLLAAILIGASYALSPNYSPIATGLTVSDAAGIVSSLEKAGYKPRVSADNSVVSLPEGDIARARMALAENGLTARAVTGWEIFDNRSAIGTNSFLQRIDKLRALEGELIRSIETMDQIQSARVNLVLPDRDSFSQERPEPSASVIIKSRMGANFSHRQALAVRNLVAGAVPDLSPDRVIVLSSSGETILGADSEAGGNGMNSKRERIEDRLTRNIEALLAARVGLGNVRVKVAVSLDTQSQVEVKNSFDPTQQVPRSETTSSEQTEGQTNGQQTVDVANNMPGNQQPTGNGGQQTKSSKSSGRTDYEVGSTQTRTVSEAGDIRKLSVAVLVNGVWDKGQYTPRSTDEIDQFTKLVKSAVGFEQGRGDDVTVETMQFTDDDSLSARPSNRWLDLFENHFGTIWRSLIGLLVVALALLFGVRPLLSRLQRLQRDAEEKIRAEAEKDTNEKAATSAAGTPPKDDTDGAYVALHSVDGVVMRRYLDELSANVTENEEEALRVLRMWIGQKT